MHYIFKVLILSGDPETSHFYTSSAFGEPGEDKETYFEWYKELKIFEDICDLEIDAITEISADLDEIIPVVDGIIYFLNPLIKEEYELLKMVLPDIFSVKRDIPTVIIFYDQTGILSLSVNELLTDVWVNYPSLEAFANLNPKNFHQALQSLCLAMINGESPLNIENAWMRFPIFIQMANVYFNNQNYYYAAQAVRKAAMIAEIYNREDYFVISEQAAYLYSKINLYLEASKILENIDKRKSVNFKTLYVEAMIREGNIYFNKKEYELAAKQYERAGQWASIEILEKKIIDEAFRLAITSWISACKVENAFRILESLSHQETLTILKEITKKIGNAAEFLVETKRFGLAREQLYNAIKRYQREALSDELKELTTKLTELLLDIFKFQVKAKEIYAAKYTYDEIENMWDSYKVKRTDLDSSLKILINLFIERKNFGIATILINKLNSLKLKQELTKYSAETEDKYRASLKKEVEDIIRKGIEVLTEFVNAELEIIVEMNVEKIKVAEDLIKKGKYQKASTTLRDQADYLKKIGREEVSDQIGTKSLDILLEGNLFEEFFKNTINLSIETRKKYFIRVFSILLDKLKGIEKLENFEREANIMEDFNRAYRNHSLYEESKQISMFYIKIIKHEALDVLQKEESLIGIRKAIDLLKKAENVSSSYLEKEDSIKIKYDKIYKKIAAIYIKLGDLANAQAYTDRIINREYRRELHNQIEELETKRSIIHSEEARETREGQELEEMHSIIENRAREYRRIDQENELRERTARKTIYFTEALQHINEQEYDEAIELYKKSIVGLNKIRKYNLASVSLALVSLILFKENRVDEVKLFLEETIHSLSGWGELFSETFPVTLVKYMLQCKKFQSERKFNEALSFMQYLPLFTEEEKFLHNVQGDDYNEEEIIEPVAEINKVLSERQRIEIDQRFGKIQSKVGEIRREQADLLNKRKAMKRIFYGPIFHLFETKNYKGTATKYYELAETLVSKRKDLKTGSLLILLCGLCLLKVKESYSLIRESINQFLISRGINKRLVEDTYEIMLIHFIIDVKEYNLENYLEKIKGLLEILPLLEEELGLLDI